MTMTETFELSLEKLRSRRGNKWNRYGKDVLPAWVADMDFAIAPPVQEVIEKLIVEEGDYGYGYRANATGLANLYNREALPASPFATENKW